MPDVISLMSITGVFTMQLPTVENKLSEFDVRLSRIEGITEQIATRLTSLETRLTSFEQKYDHHDRDVRHRRHREARIGTCASGLQRFPEVE